MDNQRDETGDKKPLKERLGWFAGIWLASLLIVAGAAYLLRGVITGLAALFN